MKPSIGPATIIGWALALAGIIAAVVISIEENETLFTGSSSLPVKLAAGIVIATNAGRHYQAAKLPGAEQVGEVIDALPPELQGAPTVVPPPDNDDGPHVDRSGADVAPPPAA